MEPQSLGQTDLLDQLFRVNAMSTACSFSLALPDVPDAWIPDNV
jgi:hypothetical protein